MPLKPLHPGDTIRMKLLGEEQWSLGSCKRQVGTRSYFVECQGQMYCHNRRQPQTTEEYQPNNCETEALEEVKVVDEEYEMPEGTVTSGQSPSDSQQMSVKHPTMASQPGTCQNITLRNWTKTFSFL